MREASAALLTPGKSRVHIRKDTGNHPGPNFTGRAGIPAQQKKQPDCRIQQALPTRAPPGKFQWRKPNKLERSLRSHMSLYPERSFWKCNMPSHLAPRPMCRTSLQKEKTQRGLGSQRCPASGWGSCFGGQADRLSHGMAGL